MDYDIKDITKLENWELLHIYVDLCNSSDTYVLGNNKLGIKMDIFREILKRMEANNSYGK